ncbi:Rab GTPase-activating protein 1 [Xenoophorus captivus]|uniref:Rab GTPase-activating protein 1 n=1 Tax=Xenoophorus captivus TaxID=1517983 RepID=A0ABV0QIZ2_9TELE
MSNLGASDHGVLLNTASPVPAGTDPLSSPPPKLEMVLPVQTAQESELNERSYREIANYPIYKILFCVRGHDGTPESDCFAFTESHHNAEIFRIHVFRCQIREAVRILLLSNSHIK